MTTAPARIERPREMKTNLSYRFGSQQQEAAVSDLLLPFQLPLASSRQAPVCAGAARASQRLAEARGALLLVLAEAGLEVTGYANNVVKKAVTGVGRASKIQVQTLVTRILGLETPPASFDAADALALALCHHQRPEMPGSAGLAPRVAAAIEAAKARRPRDA